MVSLPHVVEGSVATLEIADATYLEDASMQGPMEATAWWPLCDRIAGILAEETAGVATVLARRRVSSDKDGSQTVALDFVQPNL